jgi:CheY-like chemotaxis protein
MRRTPSNSTRPIIIIEDDPEDRELFNTVFSSLNISAEVLYFENGIEAYDYLVNSAVSPFIIISDINMPFISGFDLRNKIYENDALRLKCIPYIFFTTGNTNEMVKEAYSTSVQGYFKKPDNLKEYERVLDNIISYWSDSITPS